ncbi:MAG: class I SAM-dependent methyltransferase [Tepidisphaeraceae bacterium]|jgi:cephalosporin hydroxylase
MLQPAAAAIAAPATQFQRVCRHLHATSPFDGLDLAENPLDLHGFGQNAELFAQLVGELAPGLIIEVGTWYGKSAATWAQAIVQSNAAHNKQGGVLCIDTWLGAREMWEHQGGAEGWWSRSKVSNAALAKSHQRLRLRNGYPQFYQQFLANMVHLNLQEVIIPFPTTSVIAGRFLRDHGYHAEIIYVDGSHEYDDVTSDLELYWQLVAPGGALVGDDIWIDEVQRAVERFAGQRNLSIVEASPCWFIRKPTLETNV